MPAHGVYRTHKLAVNGATLSVSANSVYWLASLISLVESGYLPTINKCAICLPTSGEDPKLFLSDPVQLEKPFPNPTLLQSMQAAQKHFLKTLIALGGGG